LILRHTSGAHTHNALRSPRTESSPPSQPSPPMHCNRDPSVGAQCEGRGWGGGWWHVRSSTRGDGPFSFTRTPPPLHPAIIGLCAHVHQKSTRRVCARAVVPDRRADFAYAHPDLPSSADWQCPYGLPRRNPPYKLRVAPPFYTPDGAGTERMPSPGNPISCRAPAPSHTAAAPRRARGARAARRACSSCRGLRSPPPSPPTPG